MDTQCSGKTENATKNDVNNEEHEKKEIEDTIKKLTSAKDDIVTFLTTMMSVDSTTGKEWVFASAVQQFLKNEGFTITIQPIPDQPKRFNILATWGEFKAPGPKLLFNTHLDTVPPFFGPTSNGTHIFGRGSGDAKGQIASQIFALRQLIKEEPKLASELGLLLVVGEEVDHIGMLEANTLNLKPDYLIVGEPTDMLFASIQKGAVKIKLTAQGVAVHSGYPELGESAIEKLLDVLNDVRRHEWIGDPALGKTTLNIGLIEGGQALNALAAHASASIFIRAATSAKECFETIQTIVNRRVDVQLLGTNEPIILTKPPQPYKTQPVSFNTDIPFFDNRDSLKGTYLYGPGSITNAHGPNERIAVQELKESVNVLADLVRKLMK